MSYGIEPGHGAALIVDWLAPPYDPQKTTAALLGLSPSVTRQLLGAVLATSPEAKALLAAMPVVLRSLAIATTDRPQRCHGEIRGPVLWAETISARSASAGDTELFVCATTTRAYDTDQNRVLAAALELVRVAGRQGDSSVDDAVVRRAHHNSHQAARFLDHQALAMVEVTRPSARALRRTRAGSRRHSYRPALDLLRRAGEPLGAELLHAFADERTRAQHDLLASVLQRVEARTGDTPALRSDRGGLTSGMVTFRLDGPGPVRIGPLALDVPESADQSRAPAGVLVALTADDVDAAVLQALG